MSEEERQVFAFIPALAPLLLRAEELKGGPLTEQEVLRLRDAAKCVTVTPEQMQALEESRGYRDIDPEDCWAEWQRLRAESGGAAGSDSLIK